MFFTGVYLALKVFSKKLLLLLSMEFLFVCLILLNLSFSFFSFGSSSFFNSMLFLGFMVLDSVLGLCLLICSSRNSSIFSNFYFNY